MQVVINFFIEANEQGVQKRITTICAMDGVSRRDAVVGLAGAVLGFMPLRADAQFNVVKGTSKDKEKSGKKKGVRYV